MSLKLEYKRPEDEDDEEQQDDDQEDDDDEPTIPSLFPLLNDMPSI